MVQININLVFEIINLLVLYLLLRKFLFGPVMNVMERRKAMIEGGLKHAEDTEKKANELKEQYEIALSSAKEKSGQIVEQAKLEAKRQADQILADAQKEAGQLIARGEEAVENQKQLAMQQMESQVAQLAMDAAYKIIGQKTSEENDLSLYDQFIEKAGDSHDTDSN